MRAAIGVLLSLLVIPPCAGSAAWAEQTAGSTWTEPTTEMTFVWVPAGCFQMGANENPSEQPVHRVCLQGFWLGRDEVTQQTYQQLKGHNPSFFKGGDRPVEQVSWDDAIAFAAELGQRSGKPMRLPSEAEWEYACRAGGQHETYCGPGQASDLAWFSGDSATRTHAVGKKQANAWGLRDMSGNVWEWLTDCWHADYTGAPTDGSAWSGTGSCPQRVARGGGWFDSMPFLHAAYRNKYEPSSRFAFLGFRLVMKAAPDR